MKYMLVATLTEYCSCDVYAGLLEPIRHSNIAPMGLSNEAGLSVDCGAPLTVSILKEFHSAQNLASVMVRPPFPFSAHPWPPLTPSASSPSLPPPLCSTSEVYSHILYNYIAPTLRLTADQYWTHLDLVPMPRATVYIPFLHLSYLPDPFSLTIMGNYSFLV